MRLVDLPNEILGLIAQMLPKNRDKCAFLLTCTTVRNALADIDYIYNPLETTHYVGDKTIVFSTALCDMFRCSVPTHAMQYITHTSVTPDMRDTCLILAATYTLLDVTERVWSTCKDDVQPDVIQMALATAVDADNEKVVEFYMKTDHFHPGMIPYAISHVKTPSMVKFLLSIPEFDQPYGWELLFAHAGDMGNLPVYRCLVEMSGTRYIHYPYRFARQRIRTIAPCILREIASQNPACAHNDLKDLLELTIRTGDRIRARILVDYVYFVPSLDTKANIFHAKLADNDYFSNLVRIKLEPTHQEAMKVIHRGMKRKRDTS